MAVGSLLTWWEQSNWCLEVNVGAIGNIEIQEHVMGGRKHCQCLEIIISIYLTRFGGNIFKSDDTYIPNSDGHDLDPNGHNSGAAGYNQGSAL